MLSSKIDPKALAFLKKITKKGKGIKKKELNSTTICCPATGTASDRPKFQKISVKKQKPDQVNVTDSSVKPSAVCDINSTKTVTDGINNKTASGKDNTNGKLCKNNGDETGDLIDPKDDLVAMAIEGYQNYVLETAAEVQAKIKMIVKDETTSPVTSCVTSVDSDLVTIAPKRGQVHRLVGKFPELATDTCDLCGYKSSKEGVLRHKQRRHPKTVYKCQVCSAGFGVRYDMRRHRLNHFTALGQLNKRGQRLWVKTHPDVDPDLVYYKDFEENFVVKINSEHNRDAFHRPGGSAERIQDNSEQTGTTPIAYPIALESCTFRSNNSHRNSYDGDISDGTINSINTQEGCAETVRLSNRLPNIMKVIRKSDTEQNQWKAERSSRKVKKKNIPRYPPKDTSRMDCPVCKQNFPQKVLAVHMKIHSEKLPMVCPYCPVEFTDRGKMNVHIRAKHQNHYTCQLCGKVLGSATGLKYHIQGTHADKVVCLFCQKNVPNQQSLYIHMKREHSGSWRFSCTQCGKKFFDRRSLQYHVVSHLDADVQEEKKQHRCPICGKGFLRKQSLLLHQNTHVGMKPFRCQLCSKGFAFACLLTKHMKVHSEVCEFPCPYCHKAFKFACKLKYHMIIHTKERKHVCKNCDKIFTTSTGLKKHACKTNRLVKKNPVKFSFRAPPDVYSSHVEPYQDDFETSPQQQAEPIPEETLYVCGVCNMAFPTMDAVNTHVQTHSDITVVIEDGGNTYVSEDNCCVSEEKTVTSEGNMTYETECMNHVAEDYANVSESNTDVSEEQLIISEDDAYVLRDNTNVLGQRSIILEDKSQMVEGSSHILVDNTYLTEDNINTAEGSIYILKDNTYSSRGTSQIPENIIAGNSSQSMNYLCVPEGNTNVSEEKEYVFQNTAVHEDKVIVKSEEDITNVSFDHTNISVLEDDVVQEEKFIITSNEETTNVSNNHTSVSEGNVNNEVIVSESKEIRSDISKGTIDCGLVTETCKSCDMGHAHNTGSDSASLHRQMSHTMDCGSDLADSYDESVSQNWVVEDHLIECIETTVVDEGVCLV